MMYQPAYFNNNGQQFNYQYYRDPYTGQIMMVPANNAYMPYGPQQQQQQAGGGLSPVQTGMDAYKLYSNMGGPTEVGGYSLGNAAAIAAIIAGQHEMSKATDRRFAGQATKDVFGGSFATDPWQPFAYQNLGLDKATRGEEFDAAWQNKDWSKMAKTGPLAAEGWIDPGMNVGYDVANKYMGSTLANVFFPNHFVFDKIGGFLSSLF